MRQTARCFEEETSSAATCRFRPFVSSDIVPTADGVEGKVKRVIVR